MVTQLPNHHPQIKSQMFRPKAKWTLERCSLKRKISVSNNRHTNEATARAQTVSRHNKYNSMDHRTDYKTSRNSSVDSRETSSLETSNLRVITLSINSSKVNLLPTLIISSRARQQYLVSLSSHSNKRLNLKHNQLKPSSNRVTMEFLLLHWLTCSSRWPSEFSSRTLTTSLARVNISARRNTSSSPCIRCSCSKQRVWEPILINRQLNLRKSKPKSMIKA